MESNNNVDGDLIREIIDEELGNFVPKYSREELESFVSGIRNADHEMKSLESYLRGNKNSDLPFYIINLHGSLPLFDVLTIVNSSIDIDRAVYFPGSSRIQRSKDVLRYCFENFLWEKQHELDRISPLFSIDEVVGGHSVERFVNSYNSAVRRVAKENLKGSERRKGDIDEESYDLRKKFPLYVFGIRDMRSLRKMNQRYRELSNPENLDRIVREFPVKRIITMDDPDYGVIEFEHPQSSGWTSDNGYYPRIEKLIETRHYRNLLHDIARLIGADPEKVDPSRASVIANCERYSQKPLYD